MSEVASPSEIDVNVLAALDSRLGRRSMVGLVAAHLKHGSALIERLDAMAVGLDRKELESIGHQIVGSCGSIGLVGLSQLGSQLEDEAAEATPERLQQLIAATLAACHAARDLLSERYPEACA